MIFSKLDYTIEKTFAQQPTLEQKFIFEFTGKRFPALEAEYIWSRVIDHKWYISERLNRDIGLRVAAVDYLNNIYEPSRSVMPKNDVKSHLMRIFKRFINATLEQIVGIRTVT
jgi:hypothetical protein